MKKITKPQNYSTLITNLATFIEQGRKTAVRYVKKILKNATRCVANLEILMKRIAYAS